VLLSVTESDTEIAGYLSQAPLDQFVDTAPMIEAVLEQ
jgi:hypothetical protein